MTFAVVVGSSAYVNRSNNDTLTKLSGSGEIRGRFFYDTCLCILRRTPYLPLPFTAILRNLSLDQEQISVGTFKCVI